MILALWSAPRCRSTAFFRMMLERGDFQVLHEPFSVLTEAGQTEVDGVTVRSQTRLLATIRAAARRRPLFFKDTTDERYQAVLDDRGFLGRDATHVFLIRDPRATIASYYAINPSVRPEQIGFGHLHELFTAVAAATGRTPLVIEADELVRAPEPMVRRFCAAVGIAERPEALRWRSGERAEWSPTRRWHRDVSATSGFTDLRRPPAVDVATHPVLREHLRAQLPYYRALHQHRLRLPSTPTAGSLPDRPITPR